MDRDFKSRLDSIIVSKGTEEQRPKTLLKFRTHVVAPIVAWLDWIDPQQQQQRYWLGGWKLAYILLFLGHFVAILIVCSMMWIGLFMTLWGSKQDFNRNNNNMVEIPSSSSVVYSHISAICYAFHLALLVLVWSIRRLVLLMHRKSKVLDQFLQQILKLSAKEDLGISVHQLATRAKLWSRRWMISTLTMLMISIVFYRWTPQYGMARPVVVDYDDGVVELVGGRENNMLTVDNDDDEYDEMTEDTHPYSRLQDWLGLLATFLVVSSLASTLRCHQFSIATSQSSSSFHARILLCLILLHRVTLTSHTPNMETTKDDLYTGKTITTTGKNGFGCCHSDIKAVSPPNWNVVDKNDYWRSQHSDPWLWLGG
jgi:hypothetical protein